MVMSDKTAIVQLKSKKAVYFNKIKHRWIEGGHFRHGNDVHLRFGLEML